MTQVVSGAIRDRFTLVKRADGLYNTPSGLAITVSAKPLRDRAAYLADVMCTAQGDPAQGMRLVTFLNETDGAMGKRYTAGRFSYLTMSADVFRDRIEVPALELDKRYRDGEFTDTVASGTLRRLVGEVNGVEFTVMASKNNPVNTVVFWTILNPNSSFAGLHGRVTVADSRYSAERRCIASVDQFGAISFDADSFWFCRMVQAFLAQHIVGGQVTSAKEYGQARYQHRSDIEIQPNPEEKLWVPEVRFGDETGYLGAYSQTLLLRLLSQAKLASVSEAVAVSAQN